MNTIKSSLHSAFPDLYLQLYIYKKKWAIRRQALSLKKTAAHLPLETLINRITARDNPFAASQRPYEIHTLLNLLKSHQPRNVCEIGTFRGGTLFLFCQIAPANARLLSIDLKIPKTYQPALHAFAQKQQHIHLIEADSHSQQTLMQVRQILNGDKLDFLLIDGDHSYNGVKADFENFSPLVRSGGIIALHDIVPDYQTSRGIETFSQTGEVPVYWQALKQQYRFTEIIQDQEQDGFGIGVIHW